MPFFTLRPGQQCGHAGRDLQPGEVIELPAQVGQDVRDKLMPCSEDGTPLDDLDALDLRIAQAAPHEQDSLREEKAKLQAERAPQREMPPQTATPPPPPNQEPQPQVRPAAAEGDQPAEPMTGGPPAPAQGGNAAPSGAPSGDAATSESETSRPDQPRSAKGRSK